MAHFAVPAGVAGVDPDAGGVCTAGITLDYNTLMLCTLRPSKGHHLLPYL